MKTLIKKCHEKVFMTPQPNLFLFGSAWLAWSQAGQAGPNTYMGRFAQQQNQLNYNMIYWNSYPEILVQLSPPRRSLRKIKVILLFSYTFIAFIAFFHWEKIIEKRDD
jgi:hypothetical protein